MYPARQGIVDGLADFAKNEVSVKDGSFLALAAVDLAGLIVKRLRFQVLCDLVCVNGGTVTYSEIAARRSIR